MILLVCPNSQDPTECKRKFPKVHFSGLLANRALDNQVGGGITCSPTKSHSNHRKKPLAGRVLIAKISLHPWGEIIHFPIGGTLKNMFS